MGAPRLFKRCLFCFGDGEVFAGFAVGSTWNGFDNVAVTPEVRAAIVAHAREIDGQTPDVDDLESLPVDEDGLIDLSNGWATQVVPSKARDEFPDYDDWALWDRLVSDGWEDASWHNDTCPSFARGDITLYADWADPEQREFPGAQRFLAVWGAETAFDREDDCSGETLEEVFAQIAEVLPARVGGFARTLANHDYGAQVEHLLREAFWRFAISDPAEVGQDAFRSHLACLLWQRALEVLQTPAA